MNRDIDSGSRSPQDETGADRQHKVVAQFRDHPNILERIIGLFRQRGYFIESLTWELGAAPETRQMVAVVGTDRIDLLVRQLERLVDAIEVQIATTDLAEAGRAVD